jgi:methylphosphotriester-DNA--protein-cysteine methyltransferase
MAKKKILLGMNVIDAVIEILIHIEWNLKETIDISRVSKEVGYTAEELGEAFCELTSCTIHEYIQKRRFTEIMKHLVETNNDVEDIAEDFSFPDINVFVSFMQETFRVNPFRIRKGHPLDEFELQEALIEKVIEKERQACNLKSK